MNFKTTEVDVNLYELEMENIDTEFDCTINWSIDFEAREWGIKYSSIAIDSIELNITWEKEDEDEPAVVPAEFKGEGSFDLDVSGFTIEEELDFDSDGGVMVSQMDVFFLKKKIVIS